MGDSMGAGGSGGRRGGLFDDLAGVAGGAFSALAGLRSEVEAAARSQVEALVQRLELVRREEFDAAMEVARRAREEAEALAVRVAALEARLGTGESAGSATGTPPITGTVPAGSAAAEASAGVPNIEATERAAPPGEAPAGSGAGAGKGGNPRTRGAGKGANG